MKSALTQPLLPDPAPAEGPERLAPVIPLRPDGHHQPASTSRRLQALAAVLVLPLAVAATVLAIRTVPPMPETPATPPGLPGAVLLQVEHGVQPAPGLVDRLEAAGVQVAVAEAAAAHGPSPATTVPGNRLPPATVIRHHGDHDLGAARALRAVLGAGTLRASPTLHPSSPIIISIGKDLTST